MQNSLKNDVYVPLVAEARRRMDTDPVMVRWLSPELDPRVLELSMIEYCARGVAMTAPVEGWIRRAGERCIELGLPEIGKQLISHAHHEADHDKMFVDDVRFLVARWNSRYPDKLDADRLIDQAPCQPTIEYIDLHEKTITSDAPFGQVAIEREIEGLSVTFVPKLLEHFRTRLGDEFMKGVSFLKEHALFDIGHTHFNERLMDTCLAARPEHAETLGRIGATALDIYYRFFGFCVEAAEARVQKLAA